MSFEAMSYVWQNFHGKIAHKLVLVKLASMCNDGGFCFPSIARLCTDCGMTERYAQKVLRELESSGELIIYRQSGIKTSSGYTNLYYLAKFCKLNKLPIKQYVLKEVKPDQTKQPEQDRGEQHDTPDTPENDGVNNSTPDGVNNEAPDGVNNSAPKSSIESSVQSTTFTTPPTTQQPAVVTEGKTPVKPSVEKPLKDELLPVVDNKLSGDEYQQYMDIIHRELKATRGQDMIYYHVLRGTSKKYKAYSLTDNPLSLDEFRAYIKWYKQIRPGLSFPGQQKIASNVEEYRQTAKPKQTSVPAYNPDPYGMRALQEQIAKESAA